MSDNLSFWTKDRDNVDLALELQQADCVKRRQHIREDRLKLLNFLREGKCRRSKIPHTQSISVDGHCAGNEVSNLESELVVRARTIGPIEADSKIARWNAYRVSRSILNRVDDICSIVVHCNYAKEWLQK